MSINSAQDFLVDEFIEQIAEGIVPSADSAEAKAYQEWRMAEIKESFDSRAELLQRRVGSMRGLRSI